MKLSNPKKFAAIKARLANLKECHAEDIKTGAFLRIGAIVVSEAIWMAKELDRLSGSPLEEDVEVVEDELVPA